MEENRAGSLQISVTEFKAPISRESIKERVKVFESRLNGKILPFLGLHGSLLSLLYLIEQKSNSARWSVFLAGFALFCGLLTAAYHFTDRMRDITGSAAMAFCFGLIAVLLWPSNGAPTMLQSGTAVGLCLALLALNTVKWVSDYEFNTVYLYLPLIFFVPGSLSGAELMLSAVVLYSPALYVKFWLQPESNKVPLGFSVLVFLGKTIDDNAQFEGLIAVMVFLLLILFAIYSFRLRRVIASSYRYFLVDGIVMGLWGLLVNLMHLSDSGRDSLIVWGIGVAAYQSFTLLPMLYRSIDAGEVDARSLTERDARLVWLQIASWAMFSELIISGLLKGGFGVDKPYVGTLIIIAPFILLFRRLEAPFLALATRLWIAGCLIVGVLQTIDDLAERYTKSDGNQTPDSLHNAFLNSWFGEVPWVTFGFVVALAATMRVTPGSTAWWRGIIRPRHIVLMRRGMRLVFDNANRIAFVGGFIATFVTLSNWMSYAGSNNQRSRDMLLIGAYVYAVAVTTLFSRYWVGCCDAKAYPLTESPLILAAGDLPFVLACCLWGTLLYLHGVLGRDYLARFFATAFVVTPLATFAVHNTLSNSTFFAQVALACCLALFGFGVLRRAAG